MAQGPCGLESTDKPVMTAERGKHCEWVFIKSLAVWYRAPAQPRRWASQSDLYWVPEDRVEWDTRSCSNPARKEPVQKPQAMPSGRCQSCLGGLVEVSLPYGAGHLALQSLSLTSPAGQSCLPFTSHFLTFCIVIQLQLCAFFPHPSTPPQPNPPPSPTSTLPLDFVHVSFIVVPVIPSPHCPLPTPPQQTKYNQRH